jgi:hypothetical protein
MTFSNPTNIFDPASTPAHAIFGLSLFVLAIVGLIFVVVAGLLVYAVIKFRKRATDDGHEPAQVYGSTQIELAWTIIPILIVVIRDSEALIDARQAFFSRRSSHLDAINRRCPNSDPDCSLSAGTN